MSHGVARYIKHCEKCQTNQGKAGHIEPRVITPISQRAFDVVGITIIGPFPEHLGTTCT